MTRKNKKKETVHVLSAEEAWQIKKPRYNAWQCGHGKHKSKKDYDRNDKSWKDEEWQLIWLGVFNARYTTTLCGDTADNLHWCLFASSLLLSSSFLY